jgi:hypothetical protein
MIRAFFAALILVLAPACGAYDAAVEQQAEQINTDAQRMLSDIEIQVARDAEDQYGIVARNGGSAMDRCVQAGMVAAAFLQANAEGRYQDWKKIEDRDCAAAGLRR